MGSWLYGVACRMARQARTRAARRGELFYVFDGSAPLHAVGDPAATDQEALRFAVAAIRAEPAAYADRTNRERRATRPCSTRAYAKDCAGFVLLPTPLCRCSRGLKSLGSLPACRGAMSVTIRIPRSILQPLTDGGPIFGQLISDRRLVNTP